MQISRNSVRYRIEIARVNAKCECERTTVIPEFLQILSRYEKEPKKKNRGMRLIISDAGFSRVYSRS